MSIYKVKVKCIKCNCSWTEDADETEITADSTICQHCGENTLKLAIFNDSIANIDDEINTRGENEELENHI